MLFYNVPARQAGAALLDEDKFHYVVTPNPEFILAAERDSEFRQAWNGRKVYEISVKVFSNFGRRQVFVYCMLGRMKLPQYRLTVEIIT